MPTAFVMIEAEPSRIATLAQQLADTPGVAEVYSVTGEFDIIVVLRTAEYDQLAETVPDSLARLEGVRRTNTIAAFRQFSRQDEEAGWDIGVS